MDVSLCVTCKGRPFKKGCIYGSEYAGTITKAEKSYLSTVYALAQESGISPLVEFDELESRLMKAGKGDELCATLENFYKSIDGVKKELEGQGLSLKKTVPFNFSVPFSIPECPNYKPDKHRIRELEKLESEGEGVS